MTRKDIVKMNPSDELQKLHLPIWFDIETINMAWTCDANGRFPHNKKHTKCECEGNTTQRPSREEMGSPTEK